MNMRDLAGWYLVPSMISALTTSTCLAMALVAGWRRRWPCAHHSFEAVVASAPVCLPRSEIFDMFLVVAKRYIEKSYYDPANTPEYQELYGGETRHWPIPGVGARRSLSFDLAPVYVLPWSGAVTAPTQTPADAASVGPR
jgi:hypothetical protein